MKISKLLSIPHRFLLFALITTLGSTLTVSADDRTPETLCDFSNSAGIYVWWTQPKLRPQEDKWQINISRGEAYEPYSNKYPTVSSRLNLERDGVAFSVFQTKEEGLYWVKVRTLAKGPFDVSDWSDALPVTINGRFTPQTGVSEQVLLKVIDKDIEFGGVWVTTQGQHIEAKPVYQGDDQYWIVENIPGLTKPYTPVTVMSWGTGGFEQFMYYAMPVEAFTWRGGCTSPAGIP